MAETTTTTGAEASQPNSIRRLGRAAGFALLFGLLVLLGGCGSDAPRYGVVLLSPNEDALRTGTVVRILEHSEINETFTVSIAESDRSWELDLWRVKSFTDSSKAQKYARTYESQINIYAETKRDGLAIREKPTIDSQRVYKLREGQTIKVLQRAEADTIGSHEGHWYRVLTTDGVSGYCFDHYLKLYDSTVEEEKSENPAIVEVRERLSRVYRPSEFRSMAESGRIRLDRFDPAYGLFTDFEERSLRIKLYSHSHSFQFEGIEQTDSDSFLLTGAGVKIILQAEETIQLVYTRENENYSPSFVYMEQEELTSQIEEERTRREEAYAELRSGGPLYTSSAYGRLEFTGERGFHWEQFGRLVPRIIPSGSSGGGTVRFDHFLDSALKQEYSGVFSLHFKELREPLVFMYSLEEGRLKLEHVTEEKIDQRVVQERASYPLIMAFFSQGER